MTKQQMIEKLQQKERDLWTAKEEYAYLFCPRVSSKYRFEWQLTDPEFTRRLHEWAVVNDLLEEMGIESLDNPDAFEMYTHKLYLECKAAEAV